MAFVSSFSSTLYNGRPPTGEPQTASSPAIQQTALPVTIGRTDPWPWQATDPVVEATAAPPMAMAGIDVNHDGRPDVFYIGVDRNHDGIPDALQTGTHTVPYAVPHVYFNGAPIPLYEAHHLQTLPTSVLRVHADHVYRTIGPSLLTSPVPTSDEFLVDWISLAHAAHLHPIREQAVAHAVPHIYHQGIPLPLYEPHQLQSLPANQMRAHAYHLYNTFAGISKPVPEHDNLLLEWLFEIHDQHLNHHLNELAGEMSRNMENHPDQLQRETSPNSPLAPHVVPHAVPHTYFQSVPIPLYEVDHLRTLPMTVLRAHANHIYKTIGPSLLEEPVPLSEHLLLEWILATQDDHLHPLRDPSVPPVPTFYHRGVPLPLFEEHQLQSMSATQLRTHANHIYDTIGAISKPVPEYDELLLRWLIEVHDMHLRHHLAQIRQEMASMNLHQEILGSNVSHQLEYIAGREESAAVLELSLSSARLAGVPMSVLVNAEAERLKDLLPVSSEDLQSILTHTLLAHGLTATIGTLKRESGVGDASGDLSPKAGESPKSGEVPPPPCVSEVVVRQFKDARNLSGEQEQFVEECTQRVAEQRARIEKLSDRLHEVRVTSGVLTEEEMQASLLLKQQLGQLDELRCSAEVLEKTEDEVKERIVLLEQEKAKIHEMIGRRGSNTEQVKARTIRVEETLAELSKEAESNENAQAQRIRRLLIHWDTPQGPKRIAAETFAHVDANHDGRLEWQNDEICRFMRLIFHYHHVAVPPWPEVIWSELFRFCELDKKHAIDVVEAMKFTRGCFEAALRVLSNV